MAVLRFAENYNFEVAFSLTSNLWLFKLGRVSGLRKHTMHRSIEQFEVNNAT
jgi:hypothetical protein